MDTSILEKIPLSRLGEESMLFLDFASSQNGDLSQHLQSLSGDTGFWARKASSCRDRLGRQGAELWGEVIDNVIQYSSRLGSSSSLLRKLEKARKGDALFVVTGQQPGLLGGPLLTAYKVLTAVTFCKILEQRLSIDMIPLYWSGGDDSDFQEVRQLLLISSELEPVSAILPPEAHDGARPVGDIGVEWTRKVWESVGPFIERFPTAPLLGGMIERALELADDQGEVASVILISILNGEIAAVDGRAVPVRRYTRELFISYLDKEKEVKREVLSRGAELEKMGYHAQLSPGSDPGIFLLEGGRRKKVDASARRTLRRALDGSIERSSPGVILRNLVQDRTFEPLAVVLGPAEVAYRAQMSGLYPMFGIPQPVSIPRLSATFIPEPLREALEEAGVSLEVFLRNPPCLLDTLSEKSQSPRAGSAARRFLGRFEEALSDFLGEVGGELTVDQVSALSRQLRTARARFERALRSLSKAGREVARAKRPWLPGVSGLIEPEGKVQERVLSLLVPFLFSGEKAKSDLLAITEVYANDLLDGRTFHIVYS